MTALTPDEILSVLRIARADSFRNYGMLLLAYKHGLRASEVCGIRLSDIKGDVLTVARKKGSKLTSQPLMAHRGNPLLDEIRTIKVWLAARPKDSGDALFPSQKGGCMHPSQFYRIFRDYAIAAGLPEGKRNCHILKHSIITHLVRAGMDIAHVQCYAGHASIQSTMQYTHLNQADASTKAQDVLMSVF